MWDVPNDGISFKKYQTLEFKNYITDFAFDQNSKDFLNVVLSDEKDPSNQYRIEHHNYTLAF